MSRFRAGARTDGGRRRRPLRTVLIVGIALIVLLVAADFAARAVAQVKFADEIQSHGFPKKPDVSIKGFPFLTQVVSRDFRQIDISSANIPEGPVTIGSVNAVLNGVRLNSSLNGATVSQLTGTALITFPELANALTAQSGALGSFVGAAGLTLRSVGNDEVKASANLLILSFSATWQITDVGHDKINARLVASSGLTSSLLGSASNITVPLPSLPLGLHIQRVSVTSGGVVATLTGHNLSLGG